MTTPLTLDALRFGRKARLTVDGYRRLMGRQRGECTWCGATCANTRLRWCSERCIDEWKIRNQPAVARAAVLARDKGICASCGADCLERRRQIKEAWEACSAAMTERLTAVPDPIVATLRDAVLAGTGATFRAGPLSFIDSLHGLRIPLTTWEADHVVPVCEGGGFCGLDGYRTLCVFCHRRETAALAGRRATGRRMGEAGLELFGGVDG